MWLIQTILTCSALAWLLHRAWQTFTKPLPELVSLLGLEIPTGPDVSLAGINSDSVTLHWTRPEDQSIAVKYFIQVNGVNVGELSYSETAITVSGLQPDNFYSLRVVATSPNNFQASSRLIRLKTRPPLAEERERKQSAISAVDEAGESVSARTSREHGPVPFIQAASTTASLVTALESVPTPRSRRNTTTSRRVSPHNVSAESPTNASQPPEEPAEGDQSISQLTEALETLRREAEDIKRQWTREEEEFESTRSSLSRDRDQLKQSLKERDEASAELRKEVANLDRQNRSVQSRRTAEEKTLQQKLNDRAKLDRDMAKWDDEMAAMTEDVRRWKEEKRGVTRHTDDRLRELHHQVGDSQRSIRALEEQIRTKGVQVKKLEEERRKRGQNDDAAAGRECTKDDEDENTRWETRLRELQTTYAKALQSLQQAQGNHRQAQERLSWWTSRGIYHPANLARQPPSEFDPTSKKSKPRRHRPRKSRTNTVSSANGFHPAEVRTPAYPVPSPAVTSAAAATSYFGANDSVAAPAMPPHSMSPTDVERLTGNAEMSPSANALLPSNLLGDEDVGVARPTSAGLALGSAVGSAAGSSYGGTFTGLGTSPLDPLSFDHHSPASSGSRSASVFSSPRESLNNLTMYPSAPESVLEGDRRSIHSNSASLGAIGSSTDEATTGSRRFAGLFSLNLNRQRGKTLDDPPSLGSLKASETQSFPAVIDHLEGLDPIGTKRRRGIHSGSWASPMSNFNFLGRSPTSASAGTGQGPASARTTAGRRKPFNMFSSKYDPLEPSRLLGEPTTPPRPSSISSAEHAFPRPSSDSQPFGWPAADSFGHRSSPLGANWAVRSDEAWSRGPSRRNSIKHGSATSLTLGASPFNAEDFHDVLAQHLPPLPRPPPPAPIGTRTEQGARPVTPKLNPAAPTFKTIFSRSDGKKAEKAEKAAERAAERERERDLEWLREEAGQEERRMSRDDHSVMTEDSVAESNYSTDPGGEPGAPVSKDRPSIFQKLTRKGSSGKFNIPWKDKTNRSRKGGSESVVGSSVGDVDDEGSVDSGAGGDVGANLPSPSFSGGVTAAATANGTGNVMSRSSLSWSSLMRKPKRRGSRSRGRAAGVGAGEASQSEASERPSLSISERTGEGTSSEVGDWESGKE